MPRPKEPPDTLSTLAYAFCSFLTVAIHTILYERDIYPKETFITARAYDFPVRQSRHPLVREWINEAVAAVETELLTGAVARISVIIFESEGKGRPLERFMWDIRGWPVLEKRDYATKLAREEEDVELNGAGKEPMDAEAAAARVEELGKRRKEKKNTRQNIDLDEQLRGVMSKLTTCSSRLKPIPTGCSYTVAIETKDESDPPTRYPQPWIPAEPSLQKTLVTRSNEAYGGNIKTTTKKGSDLGGVRTIPVRAVEAGEMTFEMWIEEGKAKNSDDSEEAESGPSGSYKFPTVEPWLNDDDDDISL